MCNKNFTIFFPWCHFCAAAVVLQVSDSDLLRDPAATTPVSRESPQSTITEEVVTPLFEDMTLGQECGVGKATMDVIRATKRILDIIRLRDFQGYQYVGKGGGVWSINGRYNVIRGPVVVYMTLSVC